MLDQQQQQAVCHPEGRPPGTVENVVVTGKARVVAEPHDPERRGDGALARRQDCPNQEHLGLRPCPGLKHHLERLEQGYNDIGQGEHDVTFRSGLVLSAYPVLFYVLYKVQLRPGLRPSGLGRFFPGGTGDHSRDAVGQTIERD